jgi:hypothetical protein
MKKLTKELREVFLGYKGDEAWKRFSCQFPEASDSGLFEFDIPPDIEKTLLCKIGPTDHSKKWLISEIPAIGYFRPIDVLNGYEHGEIVLRAILMRIP